MSTQPQYYEEVLIHPILRYILIGVLGMIVLIASFNVNEFDQTSAYIVAFIVVVLVGVYTQTSLMKVIITDANLVVQLSIFKHRIPLDNVEYVETYKPPWYRYGGFGIRFGWDWSIGYIMNYKRGVRVTPKCGRRLFFSTNHPEEVAELLNKYIVHLK